MSRMCKEDQEKDAKAEEMPVGHPERRDYLIAHMNAMMALMTVEQLETIARVMATFRDYW